MVSAAQVASWPDEREHAACPICGADNPEQRLTLRDHLSSRSFALARCRACGGTYLADPPTRATIGAYYENTAGSAMRTAPGALFRAMRDRRIGADLEPLLALLPAGAGVADVGTGDGSVADYLRRHGHPTVGLDVYPADEWANGEIAYRQISFAEAGLTGDALEAAGPVRGAVMRHVLEHVHHPVDTLEQLRAAGVSHVLVIVPNVESRLAGMLRQHWYYWDPPRHLTFFSRASLERCARRAGFRLAFSSTYGLDEIVTSAHRALLSSGRPRAAALARALRPTGLVAGGASVLHGPIGDTVVHAVLEVDGG